MPAATPPRRGRARIVTIKRALLGLGVVITVAGVLAYAFPTQITLQLMRKVVTWNLSTSLLDELPDGLHVALVIIRSDSDAIEVDERL